jgi:hypothetical protein
MQAEVNVYRNKYYGKSYERPCSEFSPSLVVQEQPGDLSKVQPVENASYEIAYVVDREGLISTKPRNQIHGRQRINHSRHGERCKHPIPSAPLYGSCARLLAPADGVSQAREGQYQQRRLVPDPDSHPTHSNYALRIRIPMNCRPFIPVECRRAVLLDSSTVVIHAAKVKLGFRITLISRLAIPEHRLGVALWNPKAL